MAELYKQFRCSIVAIQEVPEDETHKYGVIRGENLESGIYRVDEMVEKPDPEGCALEPGDHRALYSYTGYLRYPP